MLLWLLFTELLSTFLDDSTERFTKALYEKVQEIKISKESSGAVPTGGKKRNAKVSATLQNSIVSRLLLGGMCIISSYQ